MVIFIEMRIRKEFTISLEEGYKAKLVENELIISYGENFLNLFINLGKIEIKVEDNEIKVSSKNEEKSLIVTYYKLINNFIIGLKNPFFKIFKIHFGHFPIKIMILKNELKISNFLGRKESILLKVPENINIEQIEENVYKVISINKELLGIFVSNIKKLLKIKNFDRRIFRDGIYIVKEGNIY